MVRNSGRNESHVARMERSCVTGNFQIQIALEKQVEFIVIMRVRRERVKMQVTVIENFEVPGLHVLSGIERGAEVSFHHTAFLYDLREAVFSCAGPERNAFRNSDSDLNA